ncbi:hypothetical protein [Paenibacillus alvei]|uniref:Uncharacterized protein n=1 Tax=Paenibacillus alvei TaxID=44250 RepID=A0AAP7DJS8_PAEAL|nr:hypothetical protein [Paenibacillus alvei]NOJ73118.1 hypothetical protein [Paenibacillus alvei]
MAFKVTEVFGKNPISNWTAIKLTEFVKQKYGLDIQVSINKHMVEEMQQFETAQKQLD